MRLRNSFSDWFIIEYSIHHAIYKATLIENMGFKLIRKEIIESTSKGV